MCTALNIKHARMVTYRPQSNIAERVNRNVVKLISAYIQDFHTQWDKYIPEFAFALRTSVHDSTRKTPAEIFLGRKIITPIDRIFYNVERDAEFLIRDMNKIIADTKIANDDARAIQKRYYDQKRKECNLEVGQYVLRITHNLSIASQHIVGKFCPKFQGPYRLVSLERNVARLEKNGVVSTANVDQLKRYYVRAEMQILTGTLVADSGDSQVGPDDQSSGNQLTDVAQPSEQLHDSNEHEQSLLADAAPERPQTSGRKRRRPLQPPTVPKRLSPGPSAPQKRRPTVQSGPTNPKRGVFDPEHSSAQTNPMPPVISSNEPDRPQYNLRKRKSHGNGAPPPQKPRTANLHVPQRQYHQSPTHRFEPNLYQDPVPRSRQSSTPPGSSQPPASRHRATTSPRHEQQADRHTRPPGIRAATCSRAKQHPPTRPMEAATRATPRFIYARTDDDWKGWCTTVQNLFQR